MKKTILSLCLFVTLGAYAQQPVITTVEKSTETETSFTANVLPDSGSSFVLQLENPRKAKLSLMIMNPNAEILVDTLITKEQFYCRYNFKNAADGKYTILISGGKERVWKEMELNTTVVTHRNLVIK